MLHSDSCVNRHDDTPSSEIYPRVFAYKPYILCLHCASTHRYIICRLHAILNRILTKVVGFTTSEICGHMSLYMGASINMDQVLTSADVAN